MTHNPPYSLRGETGKALDAGWHTLEALGIHAAALTLRSLDADELVFSLRATPGRIIPDDGQWVTLQDADGAILFTGLAARRFIFPAGIYQFTAVNTYRGLLQTPLTDAVTGRPYLIFSTADLAATVHDLIQRARDIGLPIQPPATLPAMFHVPKMAFRAASCASALEDALKWLPDAASRMDYTTTPPTLRLTTRTPASATLIDLDADGHGVTALDLQAMPEARALSVSFVYAVRANGLIVNYSIQSAGDDSAEAHRALSIYLSGHERSELLVSEALVTSSNALLTAQASLAAANAAITAVNAQISATYAAAIAAIPDTATGFNAVAYAGIHDSGCSTGNASHVTWYNMGAAAPSTAYNYQAMYFAMASAPDVQVWPLNVCAPGLFTDAQLATAGATKSSGLIKGCLTFCGQQSGVYPIIGNLGYGWFDETGYGTSNVQFWYFAVLAGTPVDFLSMSPSAIRSALEAAAYAASTSVPPGTTTSSFTDRAEFVEAPADLAANYFARQNWLPYKGQLTLAPTAKTLPGPGDFVSISGTGLPAEHATMATPVAELSIDLATGSATVSLGPPARMTFASLQDRLRIPPEDNYQAG